jgi:hypothetical protein
MPAARRPYAPVAAWSAVHGLALLLLDGPLADMPDDHVNALVAATVEVTVAGLCAPAPDGP